MAAADKTAGVTRTGPAKLGNWLLLSLAVLLIALLAANAWQFMERREAARLADDRLQAMVNFTNSGLMRFYNSGGDDAVSRLRAHQGLDTSLWMTRTASHSAVLTSGPLAEIGGALHGLSIQLDGLYSLATFRMASGIGTAEDEQRVHHLRQTLGAVGLPPQIGDGYQEYTQWLERLLMALPPTSPMSHWERLDERVPDASKVVLNDDVFAMARIAGLRYDPDDRSKYFTTVVHVPSWSVLNISQQGDIMYEGAVVPEAQAAFDAVKSDETLMRDLAQLAVTVSESREDHWVAH